MALSKISKIAIVGGSGNVGSRIVSALLDKKQFTITALSRANSKASFPTGVTVKHVDYEKPDTIVDALKGQDALIVTLNVMAPKDTASKLSRAAADAGVPWILPNEFGQFTSTEAQLGTVGQKQNEDRKFIEELGVSSWIAVTTGFWFEHSYSSPGYTGLNIEGREMTFFDDGNVPLNTSTWPQVGRAVAALLSLPVGTPDSTDKTVTLNTFRNRRVTISSFTATQKEIFESAKRVTGTSDADWKISTVNSKERYDGGVAKMKTGDHIGFRIALYTRHFFPGEFDKAPAAENEKLGLPKEDIDECLKDAIKLGESGHWKSSYAS